MACMCGDPYCPSCGPAQGGRRCYACGAWNWDGGCENPEKCAAENEAAAKAEYEEMDREYREGDQP
jgi:hypothetical protein